MESVPPIIRILKWPLTLYPHGEFHHVRSPSCQLFVKSTGSGFALKDSHHGGGLVDVRQVGLPRNAEIVAWSDWIGSRDENKIHGNLDVGKTLPFLPPMTGNGKFIPLLYGDDWGMVKIHDLMVKIRHDFLFLNQSNDPMSMDKKSTTK